MSAPKEEPRYTLTEARAVLVARFCRLVGHDLRIVRGAFDPVAVVCERCCTEWKVTTKP